MKRIYCKTTNRYFRSISACGKFLHLDASTLSKSLQNKGYYKTKNGDIYQYAVKKKRISKRFSDINRGCSLSEIKKRFASQKNMKQVSNNIVMCNKQNNEQITLQETFAAFISKGMYSEASVLCDTLQKLYQKK